MLADHSLKRKKEKNNSKKHDMAYGDFKDLPRRIASHKVLRDKVFNIAKNRKYNGYRRSLASMIYKFIDKKSSVVNTLRGAVKSDIMPNQQLATELHKPIIRKFEKRKLYPSFKDNIWGADLADMQLIGKFDKWFWFLLCVINIFSKYALAAFLKDQKFIVIANAFQKILTKSNRKPKKIWVDKESELYNRSMRSWLQVNDTEMYSAYNKEKSVVAERFIRALKNKIYEYMTSVWKNVYIDELDDIVNKYNNTCHNTIKMKPADVMSSSYFDFGIENNHKDPNFKVGDYLEKSSFRILLQNFPFLIDQKKFLQ